MAVTPKGAIDELKAEMGVTVNSAIRDLADNLVKRTPIDSGRAKRGWKRLKEFEFNGQAQTVIRNDVPYIGVLDKGTSKQAPNGIVEPSVQEIKRRYK